MKKPNVIVIGGSFAGLTAAFEIKRLLKDKVDVTVIARQEQFVFIPSFIWIVPGWRRPEQLTFDLKPSLESKGIRFINARVDRLIETEHNQNAPAQTKPENNLSPHRVDMRRQEQFLQNIPKFKRILVPYVTSQMSDKALRYAIYLSKISNSDIFILNVVENYEDLKYVLPATIRVEQEADSEKSTKSGLQGGDLKVSVEGALRKVIEEKISLCKEAGLNTQVTYEIRTGNPSDEIVKVAELTEFDLVVMASHRITSTIKNIGSITRKVMDTIRKPILLIHE